MRNYLAAGMTAFAASLILGTGIAAAAPTAPAASESPDSTESTTVVLPDSNITGDCDDDTKKATVAGGKARWELNCVKPPAIDTVIGWVKDTRADGKCAEVKFKNGSGRELFRRQACGSGEVTRFAREIDRHTSVNGYLRTYWQYPS